MGALTKEHTRQILDLLLSKVQAKLADRELHISLSESAKDFLIEQGFDEKYGARPLLRTVQRVLEDPLAEHILTNHYPAGTKIIVNLNKETKKLTFRAANKKVAA